MIMSRTEWLLGRCLWDLSNENMCASIDCSQRTVCVICGKIAICKFDNLTRMRVGLFVSRWCPAVRPTPNSLSHCPRNVGQPLDDSSKRVVLPLTSSHHSSNEANANIQYGLMRSQSMAERELFSIKINCKQQNKERNVDKPVVERETVWRSRVSVNFMRYFLKFFWILIFRLLLSRNTQSHCAFNDVVKAVYRFRQP